MLTYQLCWYRATTIRPLWKTERFPGAKLARARKVLKTLKLEDSDEQIGVEIVRKAIEEPIRMIVQNAASIAGLLLTTEALIVEKKEEKNNGPSGPPAGMGGVY
jgi:chaperonin GroEL